MVQAGLGVSILPEVSRSVLPDDLVLVPITPHHSRNLVLCGPRDRPWLPAVHALVDSVAHLPPVPLGGG
jgi:DNA-binding transcriptional LysR family regulator